MESELDYNADLKVDIDNLDEEWLRHPRLCMDYVKAAAEARKVARKAEQKVKVIRSQLVKEAKKILEKPTDKIIEAYYRDDKRHKSAKDEWIEAEYQAAILEGAEKTFSFQRKASLEELGNFWEKGYFASPRQPEGSDINRRFHRKVGEKIRKKLDKKIKRRRAT